MGGIGGVCVIFVVWTGLFALCLGAYSLYGEDR